MANDELLDLDQDLFDFDELLRDVELFDEETPSTSSLAAEPQPQPSPPAPLPAAQQSAGTAATPTYRPARRPPPVAPRTQSAPPPPPQAAAQPAAPQPAAPRRFVLSRGVVLALSSVAALNLALLVVVVHALGTVRGMVHEVGDQVASSSASVREQAEGIARTFDEAARPVVSPRAEGEAALERASQLASRGEHQRARETLYALLAVADRLPSETRRDVEARARFLVADTWRLEAASVEALPAQPPAPPAPAEEELR